MRLVNVKTKKSVVEFQGDKTVFHNKYLEKEMKEMGIPIPHGLRGQYEGKDCVYLEDTTFQRAFREVYYVTSVDVRQFHWEEYS